MSLMPCARLSSSLPLKASKP